MRLKRFEIEYLGALWPGVVPEFEAEEYEYAQRQHGVTEAEALDNLLDTLRESGEIDDQDHRRILQKYGWADDILTAAEALGYAPDDWDIEDDDCPYHWVGLRWTPAL